jgi:hypothetical protein
VTGISHALLTVDEAEALVSGTALDVVERVPLFRLAEFLAGRGTLRGLSEEAKESVRAHRAALRQLRALGLEWVAQGPVEGALSYAGVQQADQFGWHAA